MKENPFQTDKLAKIWLDNFGDLIAAKRSYEKAINDLDNYIQAAADDAMTSAFGTKKSDWKAKSGRGSVEGGVEFVGRYLSVKQLEARGSEFAFWIGFTSANNIHKSTKPEIELQVWKEALKYVETEIPDQDDDTWMTVFNCADIGNMAAVNAFVDSLKGCFMGIRRKLDAETNL